MKHRIITAFACLALPLATLSRAADKKAPQAPARPPLEVGRTYLLMLPDGTCRACPYKGKVLTTTSDGWAEVQFDKDAAPRLWHSLPESPNASAPAFWININQVAGYSLALPAEVKPEVKPAEGNRPPEAKASPTPQR